MAMLALCVAVPAAARPGPPFVPSVAKLDAKLRASMTGVSWRPGCPVGLDDLRLVTVPFHGFDGRVHRGRLVVNRDATAAIVAVFRDLYRAGFPIRRMELIDRYRGSDFASIEADNTSAFNCRPVEGTSRWSNHAYGRAIDVNPIENPYVTSAGTTSHPASRPFLHRAPFRPGMAVEGHALVRAFDAIGWGWGGRWSGAKDYQHFSASGL